MRRRAFSPRARSSPCGVPDRTALGVAMFNPHSLLAARLLDRDPGRTIDKRFVARRLERALRLRGQLFTEPFYRLVHAEADGLPGLIIDRFEDVLWPN